MLRFHPLPDNPIAIESIEICVGSWRVEPDSDLIPSRSERLIVDFYGQMKMKYYLVIICSFLSNVWLISEPENLPGATLYEAQRIHSN